MLPNNTTITIGKLKTIAAESMVAVSEGEKAALFCATRMLAQDIEELELPGISEHIERARSSICAILGYAPASGHSRSQHLSWALGALDFIEHGMRRR